MAQQPKEPVPTVRQGGATAGDSKPPSHTRFRLTETSSTRPVAPLRPVFDAATGEEGVAEVWARGERLRAEGYRKILEILSLKWPLRPEYDLEAATDVFLVLLGPDAFRAFVEERKWSVDRWKAWVARALHRELFAPPD